MKCLRDAFLFKCLIFFYKKYGIFESCLTIDHMSWILTNIFKIFLMVKQDISIHLITFQVVFRSGKIARFFLLCAFISLSRGSNKFGERENTKFTPCVLNAQSLQTLNWRINFGFTILFKLWSNITYMLVIWHINMSYQHHVSFVKPQFNHKILSN